ncbi:MAG: aryl-alcohol dehydrogenase-like predicted oxidoreductase [Planctomycetota bacterium]|jgi:aryl-alcohol dehydrogenase-like predicted oxidoreductase
MKYRQLGQTNIQVSNICLGSMTWGMQNSEQEAHAQLDHALDAGVNFIDTAEMYPVPPKAETQGLTEQYLGTWLGKRGDRENLIIATKVSGRADWLPYLRDGKACLDKENIEIALDASLKRLQCDYIDLYQLHWPERDSNYFGRLNYFHAPDKDGVPIAETLGVLADLVKAGKIRYIGVSNETAWGVSEYLKLARENIGPRIVSIQNPYSLLNRSFEIGLAEIAHRENVGLLSYSPLGFGTLSGKYLKKSTPKDARLSLFGERYQRYSTEAGIKATSDYVELAKQYGLDPAQMALAYVNTRPFLTSTIIGSTTIDQLQANIASIDIDLPKELLRSIENIHVKHPNPCP